LILLLAVDSLLFAELLIASHFATVPPHGARLLADGQSKDETSRVHCI
jgi:hypothetical protein